MALELFSDFIVNSPDKSQTQHTLMCVKGIGDQHVYVLELDPATGALPVAGALTLTGTQDFGASNAALRVAALLGNTTGSAAFGSGAVDAQTLRVSLTTDVKAAATPLAVRLSDGASFVADANATVSADGAILGTALTAVYQTIKTLTSDAVIVSFRNTTDQNVTISVDGGVTASILLDSGEAITLDFTSAKKKLATGSVIQAKHDGVATTNGRVKCLAIY